MFYREAGQFKTSYQEDNRIFPIRQDRLVFAFIIAFAFLGVPLLASIGFVSNYTFTALRSASFNTHKSPLPFILT